MPFQLTVLPDKIHLFCASRQGCFCTFRPQAEGKVKTKKRVAKYICHIYLAFDFTFRPQAEGKVTNEKRH